MNKKNPSYLKKLRHNLGLRKYYNHHGWIEIHTSNYLIGWVYIAGKKLNEIKAFYQNVEIGRAIIDQSRDDVNEKLGISVNTGFKLPIKSGSSIINFSKLLFQVSDGSNCFFIKIKFLNKFKTLPKIKSTFNQGNVDGYESINYISGWALKSCGDNNIWMQAIGKNPIEIKCDKYRDDLDKGELLNCGFQFSISNLDKTYLDKEIWFTFDKEGKLRIPQSDERLFIKKINQFNEEVNPSKDLSLDLYESQLDKDIDKFRSELKDFEDILDEMEYNINKISAKKAKKINKFPFLFNLLNR